MLFELRRAKPIVLSVALICWAVAWAGQGAGPKTGERSADEVARQWAALIVGRWQPDGSDGVQEFKPDGTGLNIDGSKFLWRFDGRHLMARAAGSTEDEEHRLTLRFAKDAKQYELSLQHGGVKKAFFRIGKDGKRETPATKDAGEYRDDIPVGAKRPRPADSNFRGRLEVAVDVTAAPELRVWADAVVKDMHDWYPRLADAFGYMPSQPVLKIDFRIVDSQIPGESKGRRILISKQWISEHLDEKSLVAHEMVHVLQQYGSGTPGWLLEGLADYGRFFVIDTKGAPQLAQQAIEQRGAYQASATLLDWLERTKGPGIIRGLHNSLSTGAYGPATFEQITGVTEDDAWRQFADDYRTRHPEGQ